MRLTALICLCLYTAITPALSRSAEAERVERPVTSTYSIELGSAHITDTYLTPLKYSGWGATLQYDRLQAFGCSPDRWVRQLQLGLDGARVHNPRGNAFMWQLAVAGQWSALRRFLLPPTGLSAGIGPAVSLELGALYLSRNGNNPVSAKASCTFDAKGYLCYRTRLKSVPINIRYETSVPICGAFFAPDYGELYYEIYLGNHSRLAHMAWPGNFAKWDNHITATIDLGGTALRVGYHGLLSSTKANSIVTRTFRHAFIIGVTSDWVALSTRKNIDTETRIILANY